MHFQTMTFLVSQDRTTLLEPVQGIDTSIPRGRIRLLLGQLVPLGVEELEIAVDVLLKLTDRLCGKGMADDLALPCMLGAVTRVEEAAADGDESIVVLAAED